MILQILTIFVAGFLIDLLATKYTRSVAEKRTGKAVILSGVITIANFVFLSIILKESAGDGVFNILAFAGGNSLGTFFAMKKV